MPCEDAFNLDVLTFPAGRRDALTVTCALLDVPLDYAEPDGKQIQVAVVRLHVDDGKPDKRSLLVNPGGPGASGIELAVSLSAQVSDTLLGSFDIVGFDPRGVGQSTPIRCISDTTKDRLNAASPDVLTSAGFTAAQREADGVARGCSDKYGDALAQFDTVNTARDMDRIRQALGERSTDYLGFSYGTELGAQYARLFPDKVGAMVLDGAVNPSTDDVTANADQTQGFEDAFDQFAAYCRRTSPCRELGDPRRAVGLLASRADASPIRSTVPGETRRATSSLVYLAVVSALYSKTQWPTLASALRRGLAGDSRGVLALDDRYNERVDGKYTNISDANITINCNDSPRGPSDATVRATARSWQQRFPLFGLWSAASLFTCQSWQPDRDPPPSPRANTAEPVLVVGNVNDPATPYRGAQELTKVMGNARLLTWNGQGHTSYLQGSDCVDAAVDAYLVDGAVPRAGTVCRS